MPLELAREVIPTRAARAEDARDAIELLRRSITELCVSSHHDDAATLEAWLANKTVERFARWLADPSVRIVIAERDGAMRGVGSIHESGEIRLCYVLPGFQRIGVGRSLLDWLEAQARAWRLERVFLNSSLGARAFYERAAYRPSGPPEKGFGVTIRHPYEKLLGA